MNKWYLTSIFILNSEVVVAIRARGQGRHDAAGKYRPEEH